MTKDFIDHLEQARTLAAVRGQTNAHRILTDLMRVSELGGDAALADVARQSERTRRAVVDAAGGELPRRPAAFIGAAIGEL